MTAFFSWLPAVNFGTVAAGICTFWPGFRGLTPSRAARRVVWNLPKPVNVIASPDRSVLVITSMTASTAFPASRFDIPVESIGPPAPNTECRIVDVTNGDKLGPGLRGELYIRGPQIMRGYLNAPEKTAETIDPEGWLRTGDIACADEHGNFYIVDRVKELIKYKAYAIAPAELEALLLSHPDVIDAAVIPSPDEAAGEVPKAYVVVGRPIDAGQLMAWFAERVAPHKKIRRVAFVDEIPKSPSGKILRRRLVEQERGLPPQ